LGSLPLFWIFLIWFIDMVFLVWFSCFGFPDILHS
jgi:hypothetical protein